MFHPSSQECYEDSHQLNWLFTVKHFFQSTISQQISHWWWWRPAPSLYYLGGVFLWEHFCPCRVGPWWSSKWSLHHQTLLSHEPTAYVCHLPERCSIERKKKECGSRQLKRSKAKHRREDKAVWCLVGAITGMFTNTHTHRISRLTATVYSPQQLQENRCVPLNSVMSVWDLLQWVCASQVESGPLCNLMHGTVTGVY